MPSQAHLLSAMWNYRAKSDPDGFIKRWRAHLVGRGDFQKFGNDYVLIVLPRYVRLYQGDIDTAYHNARLKIKQYVRGIPGYLYPIGKV
ncbi:hypothetical protein PHPALM_36460 [Phytophthora palmivora]|uniref:Uncharacterized protein n=1 Tax=Phytophthora palmivora TaxID=4796 RepID=A0A2P4WZV9_9STRA|nr:hypothetical protein PHPALM_36460 [Phytophthora palmivora]